MADARKVVLVTGGSSGIGLATATAFARGGAAVVIAARNAERGTVALEELRRIGAETEFIQADVSRSADVEELVRATVARFGRLDVAVNNAGSLESGVFKPLADFDQDEFDAHISLNLRSVWLCMKYEIAQMLEQGGGGAIVNVASVNGLGGVPLNSLYAAAKAGVIALTKSAAQEYAANGIRVNALVAGGFRTPMLLDTFARAAPDDPSSIEKQFASMVPLGRIGDPAEAAAAILWLASDAASYVAGHSLIVDGGLTAPYR
ncbi:MAG TPA: glucose 1-dehydrogenase [Thermoanaerobaculia bacterium]|nr:glucose 1-dehydrogenase [Thermoanaerobaculia bacterium]